MRDPDCRRFAMGKIADTKTSDIAKQYKLNFETAYNVAETVFGQMLKQNNGRIFIIGSKPGLDARTEKEWLHTAWQNRSSSAWRN
jgi:NADP-dependent 3-hydroxy acid dehydrogenase YdfG